MHKKLMIACMAVTAIAAFMVVPAASASPVLTESGSALAVGSSVTAKNTGSFKFTGGFSLECEVVHLQGTVTKNTGTAVGMEVPVGGVQITNSGGMPCSSPLGATTYTFTSKLCLEGVKGTDNLTITGCGGNVVFDLQATGVTCKYEAASVIGTFATNSTPAKVTISEQPVKEVGGLFFCPDEGRLDTTLDLYTTGGTTGLTVS